MAAVDLTDEQAHQLKILSVVDQHPGYAGTWRRSTCEELMVMGLAELKPNLPFKHWVITEQGRARAKEIA